MNLIQEKQRPVTLNKLTALLKFKINKANDFQSVIKGFKLNRWQLALDDKFFSNLIENEEKAWQVLINCAKI